VKFQSDDDTLLEDSIPKALILAAALGPPFFYFYIPIEF